MSPDTAILLLDIAWWAALVGLLLVTPFAVLCIWVWLGREARPKLSKSEVLRRLLKK